MPIRSGIQCSFGCLSPRWDGGVSNTCQNLGRVVEGRAGLLAARSDVGGGKCRVGVARGLISGPAFQWGLPLRIRVAPLYYLSLWVVSTLFHCQPTHQHHDDNNTTARNPHAAPPEHESSEFALFCHYRQWKTALRKPDALFPNAASSPRSMQCPIRSSMPACGPAAWLKKQATTPHNLHLHLHLHLHLTSTNCCDPPQKGPKQLVPPPISRQLGRAV